MNVRKALGPAAKALVTLLLLLLIFRTVDRSGIAQNLSGIGIREWAYVEAFSLIGFPSERAPIVALSTSALVLVVNLVGALFLPSVPSELRKRDKDHHQGTKIRAT